MHLCSILHDAHVDSATALMSLGLSCSQGCTQLGLPSVAG